MDKTRDRQLAEELVQDTFITFHKTKSSNYQLNSVFAFLYIVLKNKTMDLHRKNLLVRKYREYYKQIFLEADDSTQAIIETRELESLLNAEIEKLPPQCRKVFVMKRQQYKTNKEIAAELDISENTVEQHTRKALRLLRVSFINHDMLMLSIMIGYLATTTITK